MHDGAADAHTPEVEAERAYVLGTHDAEIERLGFQHSVWQDEVHRAWRAAGIGPGSRVVDVGAGPGFASIDLARLVGPEGRVLAAERSRRFLSILAARLAAERAAARASGGPADAGIAPVELAELDLMESPLPSGGLDAAWCRWVACFVPDPGLLVRRIGAALRTGGVAVFHEYVEYGSYRIVPEVPAVGSFVEAVFESWRRDGGEPDIARSLSRHLVSEGFSIRAARPLGYAVRPSDRNWRWPAEFIRVNTPRLVELGLRTPDWGRAVLAGLDAAEQDPAAIFLTPTVLEIIAVKIR